MPLHQNVVGAPKTSKLYVWSETEGGPSKRVAVISAHGGTSRVNGMERAPVCNLHYYSPHGVPVNDPGLEAVIAGTVLQYGDTISSRDSQDYELSKYTNTTNEGYKGWKLIRHNDNKESYTSVGGLLEGFATKHAKAAEDAELLTRSGMPQTHPTLKLQTATREVYRRVWMDVITVRNRFCGGTTLLSWVLKELWDNGYSYEDIHCSFCRGGKGSHTPQKVDLSL